VTLQTGSGKGGPRVHDARGRDVGAYYVSVEEVLRQAPNHLWLRTPVNENGFAQCG
jgi:hypothetical protein